MVASWLEVVHTLVDTLFRCWIANTCKSTELWPHVPCVYVIENTLLQYLDLSNNMLGSGTCEVLASSIQSACSTATMHRDLSWLECL